MEKVLDRFLGRGHPGPTRVEENEGLPAGFRLVV
jgi:hypothetical protein